MFISFPTLFNNVSIVTFTVVNIAANCFTFIGKNFTRLHSLPLQALKDNRIIEVIDGLSIDSGRVTHVTRRGLNIHGCEEAAVFLVASEEHYRPVLGIPWMELHNVAIRSASNSPTFGSPYGLSRRISHPVAQVAEEGIPIPMLERPLGTKIHVTMIRALAMKLQSRLAGTSPVTLFLYAINQAIQAKTTEEYCKKQIPA